MTFNHTSERRVVFDLEVYIELFHIFVLISYTKVNFLKVIK